MARLYIANLSRQDHDFWYRVPAEEGYVKQAQFRKIHKGTQQQIHNEAPLPVLEAIVEQHRQYGLIEASEVVKTKNFIGLCFSFDHPVPIDQMHYGVDHNSGVLYDRGVRNREEAALAADQRALPASGFIGDSTERIWLSMTPAQLKTAEPEMQSQTGYMGSPGSKRRST